MVHDYIEKNFKVWSIGADEQLLPTLLPWLDQQMEDATYSRDASEEGFVLYLCLPTCGVVSAAKANFFLTFLTSFLTARPSNSIAIIIQPNKAGETTKRTNFGQLLG